MSKSTFTILFYARKNQVNRMGKAGIMIRVTVNGESVQFSSKLDIEPQLWDATNQKMIGTTKAAREFNALLDEIRTSLRNRYREIEKYEAYVTAEKVHKAVIDAMNEGKVRVLFGSTSMLGTGVNAQKRAVAVHHLDTPWRPSDLAQHDGRAVRKGNEIAKLFAGNKVDVIIYAVEKSLDSYKFNLLHCKQTFISQLKSGAMGREPSTRVRWTRSRA